MTGDIQSMHGVGRYSGDPPRCEAGCDRGGRRSGGIGDGWHLAERKSAGYGTDWGPHRGWSPWGTHDRMRQ